MSSRKTSTDSLIPIVFTAAELRQILAAYSEGVLKKGWRDYGFQTAADETLFGVIERGGEDGDRGKAILCSLTKTLSRKSGDGASFLVCDGERPVLRTGSFLEALTAFRALGVAGGKGRKTPLKVVSTRK